MGGAISRQRARTVAPAPPKEATAPPPALPEPAPAPASGSAPTPSASHTAAGDASQRGLARSLSSMWRTASFSWGSRVEPQVRGTEGHRRLDRRNGGPSGRQQSTGGGSGGGSVGSYEHLRVAPMERAQLMRLLQMTPPEQQTAQPQPQSLTPLGRAPADRSNKTSFLRTAFSSPSMILRQESGQQQQPPARAQRPTQRQAPLPVSTGGLVPDAALVVSEPDAGYLLSATATATATEAAHATSFNSRGRQSGASQRDVRGRNGTDSGSDTGSGSDSDDEAVAVDETAAMARSARELGPSSQQHGNRSSASPHGSPVYAAAPHTMVRSAASSWRSQLHEHGSARSIVSHAAEPFAASSATEPTANIAPTIASTTMTGTSHRVRNGAGGGFGRSPSGRSHGTTFGATSPSGDNTTAGTTGDDELARAVSRQYSAVTVMPSATSAAVLTTTTDALHLSPERTASATSATNF
jgi:hypothetical protein